MLHNHYSGLDFPFHLHATYSFSLLYSIIYPWPERIYQYISFFATLSSRNAVANRPESPREPFLTHIRHASYISISLFYGASGVYLTCDFFSFLGVGDDACG